MHFCSLSTCVRSCPMLTKLIPALHANSEIMNKMKKSLVMHILNAVKLHVPSHWGSTQASAIQKWSSRHHKIAEIPKLILHFLSQSLKIHKNMVLLASLPNRICPTCGKLSWDPCLTWIMPTGAYAPISYAKSTQTHEVTLLSIDGRSKLKAGGDQQTNSLPGSLPSTFSSLSLF